MIKNPRDRDADSCDPILAQAAVWLACLHADDLDDNGRSAFMTWLCEDDAHEAAFARVSHAWDVAGGLAGEYEIVSGGASPSPARRASHGEMKEGGFDGR